MEAANQQTITGPAIVNIFAPTPRMKPSADVKLGRNVFCRIGPDSFDLPGIIGIYMEFTIWYYNKNDREVSRYEEHPKYSVDRGQQ